MGWVMRYLAPPEHAIEDRYKPDPEKLRAPTVADLDKVEQLMVALARSAESLILKSSLLYDLDLNTLEAEHPEVEVKKLAAKPRVHLAQLIIRGFWDDNKDMTMYRDLLRTRFPTMNAINLTEFHQQATTSESSDWPPPLPVITNKLIESRVFTHSSVFKLQSHVFKLESTMRNNERLEFLGDSVLERAVCDMLFHHFPHDSEGALTTKKTQMVRNVKLDEFAMLYKLDKLISAHLNVPNLNIKLKIYADLFEAYIGGVYEDKGYAACEEWLKQLYAPMIAKFKLGATPASAFVSKVSNEAKGTLYKKIGSAARKIIYKAENNTTPFTMACYIDDLFLGRGSGPTKKEAGNMAALDALSKTQLIEEQANIRAAVPRTAKVTSGMDSD